MKKILEGKKSRRKALNSCVLQTISGGSRSSARAPPETGSGRGLVGRERAFLQGGMSDYQEEKRAAWAREGHAGRRDGVSLFEKVDHEGKEAGRCFYWVGGGLACLLAQVKGWKEDGRGKEAGG